MRGYSKLWSVLVPIIFLLSLSGNFVGESALSFLDFSAPSEMGGPGWTVVDIESIIGQNTTNDSSGPSEPVTVPIEDLVNETGEPLPPEPTPPAEPPAEEAPSPDYPNGEQRSACARMGLDSAYCVDKEEKIVVANLRNTDISLGSIFLNKSETLYDNKTKEYRIVNTRLFLRNLSNVLFKDTEFEGDYGSVAFDSLRLTMSGEADLSKIIVIKHNHIGIDSREYPDFDAPATLTFTNLYGLRNPQPLRNGEPCEEEYCSNFAYNPSTGVVTMQVSGFSNYSIGEINVTMVQHLDSSYGFVSDITDEVYYQDGNWSEQIPVGDFVRATFERNLVNGRLMDFYVRSGGGNASFNVYAAGTTSPLIGSSGDISTSGEWAYITVQNLASAEDTFDFEVFGDPGAYLEFDFIHDAAISSIILNSTYGTNLTSENLTVYVTYPGGTEDVKNITDWFVNSTSIMALNMPFEGGSNSTWTEDYTTYGNDGTVSGATWGSTAGHDGWGAYSFDGNDYITTGTSSSLNMGDSSFTISVWAWVDSSTSYSSERALVEYGVWQTGNYQMVSMNGSHFKVNFYGRSSAQGSECNVHWTDSNWHHLVGVFDDEANKLITYYDGSVCDSTTENNAPDDVDRALYLASRGGTTNYMVGKLDDVQIYDRALTPEQVEMLYDGQTDSISWNETEMGDTWQACVTPNNGTDNGPQNCSNDLIITTEFSACQVISSPGTYLLNSSLSGAPNALSGVSGSGRACIIIASDDVDFSCEGHSITNDGTTDAVAIVVNGSTTIDYTNVAIRNCPNVTGYEKGIYLHRTSDDVIRNSTVYNSTGSSSTEVAGIYLYYADQNRIEDTQTDGNYASVTYGNNAGISLYNSDYNNITDCSFQRSYSYGIRVSTSSNHNRFVNCNATYNYYQGVYFLDTNANTFYLGNVSRNYGTGIVLEEAYDNIFANNTVSYNLNQAGFDLTAYSDNNLIENNTIWYNGDEGIYSEDCDYLEIYNNSFRYNGGYGIHLNSDSNFGAVRDNMLCYNNNSNYDLYDQDSNSYSGNTCGGGRRYNSSVGGADDCEYEICPCYSISSSGTYTLEASMGTDFSSVSGVSGISYGCMQISADDVILDCNGYDILNTQSIADAVGVLVKGASGAERTNVTVKNCGEVSEYEYNIYLLYTDESLLQNITSAEATTYNLYLNRCDQNEIRDSTFNDSSNSNIQITGSTSATATTSRNLFVNNTIFFTSSQGLTLDGVLNNTFHNNSLVGDGNSYAISAWSTNDGNNFTENIFSGSFNRAFYLGGSSAYNRFENNTIKGQGLFGVYMYWAPAHNLFSNNQFSTTTTGATVQGGYAISAICQNNTFTNNTFNSSTAFRLERANNTHLYNNTLIGGATNNRLYVSNSAGAASVVFDMHNTAILPSSGLFEDYTNVSIQDTLEIGEQYYLRWADQPAGALPTNRFSFRDKFTQVSISSGTPSIDEITWSWDASEVTGDYNENYFELWKYSGSWDGSPLNDTPDVSNHALTLYNHVPSSDYGILQNNVSTCKLINESGTYSLKNNVEGAPIVGTVSEVGGACIFISASDVVFDCNGYNITNNGTTNRAGILVNGSSGTVRTNVTIRNCPSISGYEKGVLLNYASNGTVRNVTMENGASGSGLYGFYSYYADYMNISNCTSTNNEMGFFPVRSSDNRFEDNNASFNDPYDGFMVSGWSTDGHRNTLVNNRAYNNTRYGIHLDYAQYTDLLSNFAYNNSNYGFFADYAHYTDFIENVANDNSNHGFYVGSSNTNTLIENEAFGNAGAGIYLYLNSHLANLTNNTAHGNQYSLYVYRLSATQPSTITNFHAYNASVAEALFETTTTNPDLYISNLTIDNPAGNYTNYSSISITDEMDPNSGYSIKWVEVPSPLPSTEYASFRAKHVNISTTSGTPSIDEITWHWLGSEATGEYDESKFELWKYNASGWGSTSINNTPDTLNHELMLYGVTPESGYGILQNNMACKIISSPGTYALEANAIGAPFSITNANPLTSACIIITSDNVNFSCAGYNITNNGTATAGGIAINASSSGFENITIEDCGAVQGYYINVYAKYADEASVENLTVKDGAGGIYFTHTTYSNITGVIAYNNSIAGFYLSDSSIYNTINRSIIHDNGNGTYIGWYSEHNTIDLNRIYNNTENGIVVEEESHHISITNNNISENGEEGATIDFCLHNNFANNLIYENGRNGVFIYDCDEDTVFTGDKLYNNTQSGANASSSTDIEFLSADFQDNGIDGVYLDNSDEVTVSVEPNTDPTLISGNARRGIYAVSSDGLALDPLDSFNNSGSINIYSNAEDGVYLDGSTGALIGAPSYMGVHIYSNSNPGLSFYNSANENQVFMLNLTNNEQGIYSSASDFNNFTGCIINTTTANPGFNFANSDNNRLVENTIESAFNDGIRLGLSNSHNLLENNTVYDSGSDGIQIGLTSVNNTIINLTSHDNDENGAYLVNSVGTPSTRNQFIKGSYYSNGFSGANASNADHVGFYGVTLRDNGLDGAFIGSGTTGAFFNYSSDGTPLNSSGNGRNGISIDSSNFVEVRLGNIYGNTENGVELTTCTGTIINQTWLWDNDQGIYVDNVGGTLGHTVQLSNAIIGYPSLFGAKMTNLSMYDEMANTDSYMINNTLRSDSPDARRRSFRDIFVNITAVAGTPELERVVWNWDAYQLPGYNENYFELWSYDSAWTLLNNTPDTAANTLTYYDLAPGTDYGIFEYNATECMVIDKAGSYALYNNVEGAPHAFSGISGLSKACILVQYDNVTFDCNGYNITNNGTADAVGVMIEYTTDSQVNVTIKNCPSISSYEVGYYGNKTGYSVISNSTFHNASAEGIYLFRPFNVSIEDTTVFDAGSDTYAIYIDEGADNNITRTTVHSSDGGIRIEECDGATLIDSVIYNNSYDLVVENPLGAGSPMDFTIATTSFLNNYGTYENYTNLTVLDELPAIGGYFAINWTSAPVGKPSNTGEFHNKFLEIASDTSVNKISWHWTDAELVGHTESAIALWEYDSGPNEWYLLPFVQSLASNDLSIYNYNAGSTYGLLENASCSILKNSGTYNINNDIIGATVAVTGISGVDYTCFRAVEDDIDLAGNGHTITNNGVSNAAAFLVHGTDSDDHTNVTLRDFPGISDYSFGAYLYFTSEDNVTNNTILPPVSGRSIYLRNASDCQLNNNTLIGGLSGVYLTSDSGANSINSNIIHGCAEWSGAGGDGIHFHDLGDGKPQTTYLLHNLLYDNNVDARFANPVGAGAAFVDMQYTIFTNPSGTLVNYTNLTLYDGMGASEGYTITWTLNSSAVPPGTRSFEQKFVNISQVSGSPEINHLSWTWTDDEAVGYDESIFRLWTYSTSWNMVPGATLDAAQNTMNATDMVPGSDYGILETNATCMLINQEGTYTLSENLEGAPIEVDSLYVKYACFVVESDNVLIDCAGYNITNNGVISSTALYVNGTDSINYLNVTLRNCGFVSDYDYGAILYNTSQDTLSNISFTNNTYGVRIANSGYSIVEEATINGSTYALYVDNSPNTNLTDNTVHACTYGGYLSISENLRILRQTFYNNTHDVRVERPGVTPMTLHINDTLFLNPYGTLLNYTNLSLYDSLDAGSRYEITWDKDPGSTPIASTVFRDKFINITDLFGTVSIDKIVWTWTDAELAGFNESKLMLWEYPSSTIWNPVGGTLNTGDNTLTVTSLSPSSTYGLYESEHVKFECFVADIEGAYYTVVSDLEGAPIAVPSGQGCIVINASHVTIDCNGHTIINNGTAGTTYGIVTNTHNGTVGASLEDIEVKDCPGVSGYSTGIAYYGHYFVMGSINVQTYIDDSLIRNVTSFNNSASGTEFYRVRTTTINDTRIYNNSNGSIWRATTNSNADNLSIYNNTEYGMYLLPWIKTVDYDPTHNNSIYNSRFYENPTQFYLLNADDTSMYDSVFENHTSGIKMDLADYGYFLRINLTNASGTHIYMNGSHHNEFFDVRAIDSMYGVYFNENANNNTFNNTYVQDASTAGFYFYNAHENELNYSLVSDYGHGIRMFDSDYNRFDNVSTVNGTASGIRLAASGHNRFDNIYSRNNTEYGIYLEERYSGYNNFTTGTVRNNSIHGIYVDGSPHNRFSFLHVHNNSIMGYLSDQGDWNRISNSEFEYHGNAGIYLNDSSTANFIGRTTSSDALRGIMMYESEDNQVQEVNVSRLSGAGFNLIYAHNTSLDTINVYDSTNYGMFVSASENLSLTSANISEQPYGIYLLAGSHNAEMYETNITNSSDIGVVLLNTDNVHIEDFEIYNSTDIGIGASNGEYLSIIDSEIHYSQDQELYLDEYDHVLVHQSSIFDTYGGDGIWMHHTDNFTLTKSYVYNNTRYGLYAEDSGRDIAGAPAPITISASVYANYEAFRFNNTLYWASSGDEMNITLDQVQLRNSTGGTDGNLTFINMEEYLKGVAAFSMNWTPRPASPVPSPTTQFRSFRDTYSIIRNLTSSEPISIEKTEWLWAAAYAAGYDEDYIQLWRWEPPANNWVLLNDTPNVVVAPRTLTAYGLPISAPSGGSYNYYGLFERNGSTCRVFNDPGSYELVNHVYGADIPISGVGYSLDKACFIINTSDFEFSCENFDINNTGSAAVDNAVAVIITGVAGVDRPNVTVRNCRIHNYSVGAYGYETAEDRFRKMTITNSTKIGLELYGSEDMNVSQVDVSYTDQSIGYWAIGLNSNTDRARVENCTLEKNVQGFGISGADHNVLYNNIVYSNSEEGFSLISSYYNNISNNAITSNGAAVTEPGIYMEDSQHNTFEYNNISYSSADGIEIFNSNNNTFTYNDVYKNGHHGLTLRMCYGNANNFLGDTYYNNSYSGINITQSTAGKFDKIISENNTEGGIYIYDSENINLLSHHSLSLAYPGPDTRIKDNGDFGVWIEDSDDVLLAAYTTAGVGHTLNITGNGFSAIGKGLYIYDSTNVTVMGSDTTSAVNVYNNSNNIYVDNPSAVDTDHVFQRVNSFDATGDALYLEKSNKVNVTYSNFYNMLPDSGVEGRGIVLDESDECTFTNVSAYNNTGRGVYSKNACTDTEFYNSSIYDNGDYGIEVINSEALLEDTIFYNNGMDAYFGHPGAVPDPSIQMYNVSFLNPIGTWENYTAFSMGDSLVLGDAYSINWTQNSSELPTHYVSFRNKWINISTQAGTPSINNATWHWLESETAGYEEDRLVLYKYNSSAGWTLLNSSPDTSNNELTYYAFNPASDYGILQYNGSECMIINESGSYQLINDILGAPIAISPDLGDVDWACIVVSASNVTFDCNGYNITNNGTADAAGIYINGTAAINRTNVTLRNCPKISSYHTGAYQHRSSNDTWLNLTVENSSANGFRAYYAQDSLFQNNTARNSTYSGFSVFSSQNCTLIYNKAYNNSYHGAALLSQPPAGKENQFISEEYYNNTRNGFNAFSSSNFYAFGLYLYDNGRHGAYLEDCNEAQLGSTITVPDSFISEYNQQSGIYINNSENITVLETAAGAEVSLQHNGEDGITLYGSDHCEIGSTSSSDPLALYNNTENGIRLSYSHNNSISYSNAYNNTLHGTYIYVSSDNNVTNSSLYFNEENGALLQKSCSHNRFTDNLIYNNTLNGVRMDSGGDPATDNRFTGDRIYNNTLSGFNTTTVTYTLLYGVRLLDNGIDGAYIYLSDHTIIGIRSDTEHTYIQGNGRNGVYADNSDDFTLDPIDGAGSFEGYVYVSDNTEDGVAVYDSYDARIGRTIGTHRGVNISGNGGHGIYLFNNPTLISEHTIRNVDSFDNGETGVTNYRANLSEVLYSNIYNNTLHGLHIYYSGNTTATENNIYLNKQEGVYFEKGCSYSKFTDNRVYNNTLNGIFLDNGGGDPVNLNWFTGDQAYNNTLSGINMSLYPYTSMFGVKLLDNGQDGAYIDRSNHVTIYIRNDTEHTYIQGNGRNGAYAEDSDYLRIYPNDGKIDYWGYVYITGNSEDGIVLNDSDNSLIGTTNDSSLRVDISGNGDDGVWLWSAGSLDMDSIEIYNNTKYGVYTDSSGNAFLDTIHFFNNTQHDLVVVDNLGGHNFNLTKGYFDNPYGNYTNYTNLSISDFVGPSYAIHWTAVSRPLPGFAPYASVAPRISFRQKWVNITNFGILSGSIDEVVWHWMDSEVTGDYNESKFELWKYNASTSWTLLNETPDTGANTLTYYAFDPASDYGILQNNGSCPIISSSGTHQLTQNAEGAPNDVTAFEVTKACIIIAADNVELDCNGYNITNDGTADAVGAIVNGSAALDYTNVTLLNCPQITQYEKGAYMHLSSDNTFTNISVFNNTDAGVFLYGQSDSFIENSTAYNNSIGVRIVNSNNTYMNDTYSYNNTNYGVRNINSNYTDTDNLNITYNGINGFYLDSNSESNSMDRNYVCFNGLDISNSSAYTSGTVDTCDTFIGWTEDGHPGCTYRCSDLWHVFYGNVTGEIVLAEEGMDVFELNWTAVGYNIYGVNTNSSPNIVWGSLLALGRNTSIQPSSSDFSELDTVLGTSAYPDSVEILYSSDGTTPYTTMYRNVYKVPVEYVPIVNTTNSSTFVTGILWDSSQDGGAGQFDPAENEDVVFVSPVSEDSIGTYGTYDYEIRLPEPLATYKGTANTVDIYVELI